MEPLDMQVFDVEPRKPPTAALASEWSLFCIWNSQCQYIMTEPGFWVHTSTTVPDQVLRSCEAPIADIALLSY